MIQSSQHLVYKVKYIEIHRTTCQCGMTLLRHNKKSPLSVHQRMNNYQSGNKQWNAQQHS